MSQAITTHPTASPQPPDDRPQATPKPAVPWMKKRLLEPLASLRLTVILFALSLFLVFAGTLAQAESGNLTVINKYFRSWFVVWIPFQVFVKFGQVFFGLSSELKVAGAMPFPGGWLLGALLLTNLFAAHAIRFRMTWKRSGILLIHSGLVVMMFSEFVTGQFAVEGYMVIANGETSNIVEDHHRTELAIIDRSDPKTDQVVILPQALLRKGEVIRDARLPFDIVVERYMMNSRCRKPEEMPRNPATVGEGKRIVAEEIPEVSGVSTDEGTDVAAAYVTFKKKGTNESLGTYLVSLWFSSNFTRRMLPDLPQQLRVDGKDYEISLRSQRTYRPFTLHLLEFRHDVFQATNTPRNFSSLVHLKDPQEKEDREVKIWMNHPLRYAGETFYQAGWLPGDRGTILQVVHNPGWLMPYFSCAMVALGMFIHFGLHLGGFLRKRGVL